MSEVSRITKNYLTDFHETKHETRAWEEEQLSNILGSVNGSRSYVKGLLMLQDRAKINNFTSSSVNCLDNG